LPSERNDPRNHTALHKSSGFERGFGETEELAWLRQVNLRPE
jgi:hypothetical protein